MMEMLVVIAIIALLAGVAVPAYMRHLKKARRVQAKAQIECYAVAINDYNLDTRKWPGSLNDLLQSPGLTRWKGPYLDKVSVIPKDPWGNDYVYTQPGTHGDFDLVSYGEDGSPGGSGWNADVVSWKSDEESD
jgi:general secretion pathway protein G